MNINEIKDRKFKTIRKLAIPSTIAMLLQTAITVTDGYLTGNYVGKNALAAINPGLPILYFYLGIGLCISVGGSVISGRLSSAKYKNKTFEVFLQTIVTVVIVCIIISLAVLFLFTTVLKLLKAGQHEKDILFACNDGAVIRPGLQFRFYCRREENE